MRVLLFLLVSLSSLNSQVKVESWYGELEVKGDLLNQVLERFNIDAQFTLLNEIKSNSGKHFLYQQTINGLPVFNGGLKINIDQNNNIRSVFNYSYDESLVIEEGETFNVYYFSNGAIYEAQYTKVLKEDYHVETIDFSAGIFVNPLMCLFQDTTINVGVFDPDPLTSSGNEYGGDYVDNSDANSFFLNDQIVNRTINARYNNGSFLLENDHVIMMDLSNPIQTVVTSADQSFMFTRNEDEFEEVNAFYHISNMKNYLESIGLDTLMNYQIQVDAHALNGSDNSMFVSSFDPPRLLFGDGGVDDAEDADVIIHEYGHAISHFCAPGSNNGLERNTLDEANGDYFAASYSKSISSHNWGKVYSWDGHNEYWSGRMVITNDHYPQDLVGNRYNDADIWAATIMQIHDDIGREETDKILIESMYSYASYISMTDAARLFVQAAAGTARRRRAAGHG